MDNKKNNSPLELMQEMDFMVFNAVKKTGDKHFKVEKVLDKLYSPDLFETSK